MRQDCRDESEEEGRIVSNILYLLFKGFLITMPKRKRNQHFYRDRQCCKRRRHASCSPSMERNQRKDTDEMHTGAEIRMLKMNVDLLKAQVHILRKQVHEIRKVDHKAQETENWFCSVM